MQGSVLFKLFQVILYNSFTILYGVKKLNFKDNFFDVVVSQVTIQYIAGKVVIKRGLGSFKKRL